MYRTHRLNHKGAIQINKLHHALQQLGTSNSVLFTREKLK